MIIACPACSTRYVVPDSSIGVDGRTVRCAKCKHSWYQDGPTLERPVEVPTTSPRATTPPAPPPRPHFTEVVPAASAQDAMAASPPEPRPSPPKREVPAARPRVYDDLEGTSYPSDTSDDTAAGPSFDEGDPPYDDLPEARRSTPVYDESGSQFDSEPPFRPRRNYIKLWTWAAGIFAALALGTVVAVGYFGAPNWFPVDKPLYGVGQPDLQIDFPVEEQERRTLANGTEYFGARIIVTNTARETRAVPPILIVLRDARERIVYSWEVTPSQASLAPGETMTINEATTDVPKAAVYADIGWAPR